MKEISIYVGLEVEATLIQEPHSGQIGCHVHIAGLCVGDMETEDLIFMLANLHLYRKSVENRGHGVGEQT